MRLRRVGAAPKTTPLSSKISSSSLMSSDIRCQLNLLFLEKKSTLIEFAHPAVLVPRALMGVICLNCRPFSMWCRHAWLFQPQKSFSYLATVVCLNNVLCSPAASCSHSYVTKDSRVQHRPVRRLVVPYSLVTAVTRAAITTQLSLRLSSSPAFDMGTSCKFIPRRITP